MCGKVKYCEKYSENDICSDEKDMSKYIMYNGKRLYMRQSASNIEIIRISNDLITEQQDKSPHRYLTDTFDVCEGDVVFDVGCAEGNFSLSVCDKTKEIHLFEYNDEWISALHKTFDRLPVVSIINKKYVSNVTSKMEQSVTIDDYCRENNIEKIDLLKADVEGAELKVLEGASRMIREGRIKKICITVYHKLDDEKMIKDVLNNYEIEESEGYLLFSHISKRIEDIRPPYVVKGLIRARLVE